MYKQFLSGCICLSFLAFAACKKNTTDTAATGTVKITFTNTIKGNPIVFNSTTYTNPFAEQYTISKFKYYVSNVVINNIDKSAKEKDSYHLIDESNNASLSFSYAAEEDLYSTISFVLGVDSIKNVSGAQTGALDPTNDMFWTWNSGYIMAKMEGNSPQSTVVNNKVEMHIGGFSGVNNTLKTIILNLPTNKLLNVRARKTSEIIITANFDTWWQGVNNIKIADNPIISTPGALAKKVADNYSNMFAIKEVTNN